MSDTTDRFDYPSAWFESYKETFLGRADNPQRTIISVFGKPITPLLELDDAEFAMLNHIGDEIRANLSVVTDFHDLFCIGLALHASGRMSFPPGIGRAVSPP